jgi:hypothetical protein
VPIVDQELVVRQLTAKIEQTTHPRHRQMLERIRSHAIAEAAGSLQGLLDTLGENPAYHFWFWGVEGDSGPKGRDGIAAYYSDFVASRSHIFEYDCKRIMVDGDNVVMEAVLRMVMPGTLVAQNPLAGGDVDPAGHYLVSLRNVVFWPFDENLMIVGEDAYSGGPVEIRKLSDDELPEVYKALFEPIA